MGAGSLKTKSWSNVAQLPGEAHRIKQRKQGESANYQDRPKYLPHDGSRFRNHAAEQPAQQPGPRGGLNTPESLTAAPVCCSGWFGVFAATATRAAGTLADFSAAPLVGWIVFRRRPAANTAGPFVPKRGRAGRPRPASAPPAPAAASPCWRGRRSRSSLATR